MENGKTRFWKGGPKRATPKTIECQNCNKVGHMQMKCKAQQRDKAPMEGADGKPYQPRTNRPKNCAVHAMTKPNKTSVLTVFFISIWPVGD